MPLSWKSIFVCALLGTGVLGFFADRTRRLRAANQKLMMSIQFPSAPAPANDLAQLQKENDRLKANSKELEQLRATAEKLKSSIEESRKPASSDWQVQSNRLQAAIELEKTELRRLQDWEKEQIRAEMRAKASKRWAEKQATGNYDPTRDQEQTSNTLQKIALATQKLFALQHERQNYKGPPGSVFNQKVMEAVKELELAQQPAVPDEVLYETLPASPDLYDKPRVPFIRSVVPNPLGNSITVYLDGTVEWSRIDQNVISGQ